MEYDAVIFDKDGVLLDSAIDDFLWMDKVRVNAAAELGIDLSVKESQHIVHAGTVTEIEKFLYEKDISWDQLEEVEKKVQERKRELITEGDIRLFPNVKKTLEHINVPKAVVTNAPWETTEFTIEHFGLGSYFRDIKAPEMSPLKTYFGRKKPHPEMIEEVIRVIDAENPVMVGDTSTDVKAAENAGIDSIQVTAYGNRKVGDANHNIKNLEELRMYIN